MAANREWYGLMIEKIIRKSIVNIFMLIQTWMSSDIVGWQFVVWIVTTNFFRPRETSENVAVCRNLWRNELVELPDGDNTFAPPPEHLILRFILFYSAGDRQFENWMQVDRNRKKGKHFYTQFLRCLFWTVGVPKWTFSPFSRINHGDERIIKKEWKIYFERKKAGEKSFYSIANEGLASTISFCVGSCCSLI